MDRLFATTTASGSPSNCCKNLCPRWRNPICARKPPTTPPSAKLRTCAPIPPTTRCTRTPTGPSPTFTEISYRSAMRHSISRIRIAAVDRMREIECRMALRYEISVKVGDGPVGVRVHRVVGGIGAHVLSFAEGGVVGGFRAQIGLRQRGHRFLQQFDGDPLAVVVANNRSMMTAIHGEGAVPHRFALLEGNGYPADA